MENEELKKDSAESTPGENTHHKSWIGSIVEKIEDELENMNTDFPLSGGEDHPIHPHHHEESAREHTEGEGEHKDSFIKHLLDNVDTEFPLSGGEE